MYTPGTTLGTAGARAGTATGAGAGAAAVAWVGAGSDGAGTGAGMGRVVARGALAVSTCGTIWHCWCRGWCCSWSLGRCLC